MRRKNVVIVLVILLCIGGMSMGGIPMIPHIEGSAPTTVRYLAIVDKESLVESNSVWLDNMETLSYALQPFDVINKSDVSYDTLFSAPNTPRYNMILWDRYLTIDLSSDIDLWINWAYLNGSSLFWFYDGIQNLATIQPNFQTGNAHYEVIAHEAWVNITETPFTEAQSFQMNNSAMSSHGSWYVSQAEMQNGVNTLMHRNDLDKTIAYYSEEVEGGHGRGVWWSWSMHTNNPFVPLRIGNGTQGIENVGLTYNCVEPLFASLYWCANAPVIKALPTFALRYDDFAYVQWEWRINSYTEWWEYMRDKGIPFSSAQPTRNRAGLEPPDEQPISNVRTQWRNVFENTTGSLSTQMGNVMKYYDEGWLEIMSHGWTHADGEGNNNETNEIGSVYSNASADPNHSIFGWLNESWFELSAGATFNGYSLPVDDINIYCVSGQSYFGNKTAYAMYELNAEYVHSASPHWSGWLFPNGTGTSNNGVFVVNTTDIGIWVLGAMYSGDDPTVDEIERYTKKYWNSENWFCIPSAGYCHSNSWSQAEWVNRAPFVWIDTMEDTIESGSWTRCLWVEDVGDYDKGFKTNVGGHGSINWTESGLTWDGTTVSISDDVSIDYNIQIPHGRYVSTVTVNGAEWFVFSDTEVYIPASATSVSIVTSSQAVDTPHVDRVRRASRGVTSSSYDGTTMMLTIDGIPQLYSDVRVDCGDRGKPVSVSGAKEWSYDPSGFLDLTVKFGSSRDVSITWSGGSSSSFSLRVHVSMNTFPFMGAVVNIDGENKSTDLFGNAYFDVGVGSHDVTVYLEDKKETREIFISRDQSVGFDFEIHVPRDRGIYIFLALPIGLVLIIFIGILLWRRNQ